MTGRPDVIHSAPGAATPRHKADLSDLCDLCRPAIERNRRITAFHRSFVEFGYTDLTRDATAEAFDLAMSREPTAADGIIARLIRSQLVEAGLVG